MKVGGAETDPEDIRLAEECWEAGRAAIYSGTSDLVILDEINYTISYKMLDAEKVAEALKVAAGAGARDLHGEERASVDRGTGGPGNGDERSETPIYEGYTGAAGDRLLKGIGSW